VGPNDVGTAVGGERGRGDGGVLAVVFPSADRAVHRLVGVTDQHRTVERGELPDAVDQIERLGGRLTEAEPGVDDYLLSVDPGGLGQRESLAKGRDHVVDHVVVLGVVCRVDRRVEAMHHHDRAAGVGDDLPHLRVRQPGHVVDDVGAGVERSRRDGWLPRIHRD